MALNITFLKILCHLALLVLSHLVSYESVTQAATTVVCKMIGPVLKKVIIFKG